MTTYNDNPFYTMPFSLIPPTSCPTYFHKASMHAISSATSVNFNCTKPRNHQKRNFFTIVRMKICFCVSHSLCMCKRAKYPYLQKSRWKRISIEVRKEWRTELLFTMHRTSISQFYQKANAQWVNSTIPTFRRSKNSFSPPQGGTWFIQGEVVVSTPLCNVKWKYNCCQNRWWCLLPKLSGQI